MTAITDNEQPKVYQVEFDGKQPFSGSAVIGAMTAEAAEATFRESIPDEVTDLKVTVREMSLEERDAFFENIEALQTKH